MKVRLALCYLYVVVSRSGKVTNEDKTYASIINGRKKTNEE